MNELFFKEHYYELPEGKIHYIDEGNGDPIVFSHGTPEWSFAFRHVIQGLRPSHRCIAWDHFGFGKSDKPEDDDFTIDRSSPRNCINITRRHSTKRRIVTPRWCMPAKF